jgi:hypothetical protein
MVGQLYNTKDCDKVDSKVGDKDNLTYTQNKEHKDILQANLQTTPSSSSSSSSSSSHKEEKNHKNDSSCTEPKETSASVPDGKNFETTAPNPPIGSMPYPVDGPGNRIWYLTKERVEELKTQFPHLDVLKQLMNAQAWCMANVTKRKTSRGMMRFLISWLIRKNDNPNGVQNGTKGYTTVNQAGSGQIAKSQSGGFRKPDLNVDDIEDDRPASECVGHTNPVSEVDVVGLSNGNLQNDTTISGEKG